MQKLASFKAKANAFYKNKKQRFAPAAEMIWWLTIKLSVVPGFFLRKMLGTRYGPVGTRFLLF